MNDFNERLEEIRRRSVILAGKRNRRRKKLLTIIPAVLCAAICVTAALSDLSAFQGSMPQIPENAAGSVGDTSKIPQLPDENKGSAPPLTDGGHTAGTLVPPESAVEPGNGTLENNKLTISDLWGDRCTITGEKALQVIGILESLDYDPQKLCDCVERYRVRRESGVTYGIDLTESYARCDKGQASLNEEQINILEQIINQAMGEE